MDHEPVPAVVRVPRRSRALAVSAAVVASLVGAGAWVGGASADVGAADRAGAARCSPPPGEPVPGSCFGTSTSVPPTTSTRTSFTWTFDDGTPGGWYGYASSGGGLTPWVTPSASAAAAGRGGLLVGAVTRHDAGAAVDVDRATVAPGTYAVSARVRLAPGGPSSRFGMTGVQTQFGVTVTDGAWVTLAGSVVVPADGSAARLSVGPRPGYCSTSNYVDHAPASTFQLDQVTLARTGDVPGGTASTTPVTGGPTPSPTTPSPTTVPPCPAVSPAPPATVKIHYEVTSAGPGGFGATLVLTNLRDTPVTGWTVLSYSGLGDRRITWVSGARAGTDGSWPSLTGLPGGTDLPARGQVRISLGLTGSPIGSGDLFTTVKGEQTGRN